MELKIKTLKNVEKGAVSLPKQFSEEVRRDIITRAVLTIQNNNRQPYGADPEAGKKSSAELSRRRRKYRGSYGSGISRVPRKILSRRGTRMMWVGAFAPGTVGGRRAHAPKSEKIWAIKLNNKERQKAIRSALAATVDATLVSSRGHQIPDIYPFVLADEFQLLSKAKDVVSALKLLGFEKELERSAIKKVRAGKGKARGRKYQKKTGALLVVGEDCPLLLSAKNIAGLDVVKVTELNAELLAPGADVGRLTLYTESALAKMEKNNLFFAKVKEAKEKITVSKKEAEKINEALDKEKKKTTKK